MSAEDKSKLNSLEDDVYGIELNPGDIILVDNETLEKTKCTADELEQYKNTHTPIGIVIIPTSHDVYGTGEACVMSLKYMSVNDPDNGTTSTSSVSSFSPNTGDFGLEIGIFRDPAFKVPSYGISSGKLYDTLQPIGPDFTNLGVFSGDSGTGIDDPKCKGFKYSSSVDGGRVFVPCPYLTDGSRNPDYYYTNNYDYYHRNSLAHFEGKEFADILLKASTSQQNWKTASTITRNSTKGYYPASCCCWRYHTIGTNQGDWYLPTQAELGYVTSYYKKFGTVVNKIKSVYGNNTAILMVEALTVTPNGGYPLYINLNKLQNYQSNTSSTAIPSVAVTRVKLSPNDPRFYSKTTIDEKIYDINTKYASSDKVYTKDQIDNKFGSGLNGHDFVDMGDAGIWATCNVGASKPEEYGLHFAWGETDGHLYCDVRNFLYETYKFGNDDTTVPPSKYNSKDGLTTLELDHL